MEDDTSSVDSPRALARSLSRSLSSSLQAHSSPMAAAADDKSDNSPMAAADDTAGNSSPTAANDQPSRRLPKGSDIVDSFLASTSRKIMNHVENSSADKATIISEITGGLEFGKSTVESLWDSLRKVDENKPVFEAYYRRRVKGKGHLVVEEGTGIRFRGPVSGGATGIKFRGQDMVSGGGNLVSGPSPSVISLRTDEVPLLVAECWERYDAIQEARRESKNKAVKKDAAKTLKSTETLVGYAQEVHNAFVGRGNVSVIEFAVSVFLRVLYMVFEEGWKMWSDRNSQAGGNRVEDNEEAGEAEDSA